MIVDLPEEAWGTVLDPNLKDTFLCARPHHQHVVIKEIGAVTPVGRVGRPEDVAEVAAFLAGAAAAEYITGQSINVTGGGVMHRATARWRRLV